MQSAVEPKYVSISRKAISANLIFFVISFAFSRYLKLEICPLEVLPWNLHFRISPSRLASTSKLMQELFLSLPSLYSLSLFLLQPAFILPFHFPPICLPPGKAGTIEKRRFSSRFFCLWFGLTRLKEITCESHSFLLFFLCSVLKH